MPIQYTIKPGDCISSLAYRYGFSIDTIWNDPANATLKARRDDPHVLQEGDVVTIPDRRPHFVPAKTGKKHVFRRRNVPERLRIRLLDRDGKPRAGLACVLAFGEQKIEIRTADDGMIDVAIPPDLTQATLTVEMGEVYDLAPGDLDPLDGPMGIDARLTNLGIAHEEGTASLIDPRWAYAVSIGALDAAAAPAPDALPPIIKDDLKNRHGA